MKQIPLSNSEQIAKIDDADFDRVMKYRWCLSKNGYAQKGYGVHSMHRFIMNPPKRTVVDHINGNRLDNRRENLRIVSQSVNLHNHQSPSAGAGSPYFNVFADRGLFQAKVRVNGRCCYLGQYLTPEDARDVARFFKARHAVLPKSEYPSDNDWSWVLLIDPVDRRPGNSGRRKN